MKAVILASGKIENYGALEHYLEGADFVLCADGGARHGRRFGLKPDLIIGDLDSAEYPDIQFFKEIGVPVETHPAEKDQTDLELCLDYVIKDYQEILLLGAMGGRADHYMGNLMLLAKYCDKKISLLMVDEWNEVRVLSDQFEKKMELEGTASEFISLIPISQVVEGVTTKGLKYELTCHDLVQGSTFSISNKFLEKNATVSLEKGKMLVIKSRDAS